jgi:outer membrane protein assembly factor BamB
MTSYPSLQRGLAAGLSAGLLVVAVLVAGSTNSSTPESATSQSAATGGQDWVMYGGTPARNLVNTVVTGLPAEFDTSEGSEKNVKWSADLGSKAYGGPVVAGGRVFVGTNNQKPREKEAADEQGNKVKLVDAAGQPIDFGILMCFDEKAGKFQWQRFFKKLGGGQVRDWPLEGLCSSPVVEGDRLYYTSNRCEVLCDDVKTGKNIWKLDMVQTLGVFPHNITDCSPLLAADGVWVITANGVNEDHINVPAPKAPSFLKIDKKTGKVLWQDNEPTIHLTKAAKGGASQKDFFKRLVNRGELIQHGQWSNPAYGVVAGQGQVVFPGGDGWLRAYDTDGKLLWKFDCNPKDAEYELGGKGTRNDFIATPVIHKDRVYIGVGQDPEHETGVGHFWCIDMTKRGDVSPELVTDNTVWPPKTKKNENSALLWHYGGTAPAEVRKKTGRNYYFGRTMSTAAIHDGLCYIAELSGWLHCLDAETGKLHWSHDCENMTWSSPYWADNKVYLGTDGDEIFVFAHGTKKKLLAKNPMSGHVRATPVAANGVLYVMTENKLYAIAKK